MNAGYRAAAAGPIVTLGPLPPRPAHFVLPIVLGVLGLFVLLGDVLATLPSPEVLLRCKRTPDAQLACEEWTEKKLTRRVSTPFGQVRYRSGGRNSSAGVEIGNVSYVATPDPKGTVARLNQLAPNAEAVEDVTHVRPWVALLFLYPCGVGLVVGAILTTVGALRRSKRVLVRVTPRALEVDGRRPIARVAGDPVRVGLLQRGGRGQPPTWAILYGHDGVPSDPIGGWEAFDGVRELEPFAAQLRHVLGTVPRA